MILSQPSQLKSQTAFRDRAALRGDIDYKIAFTETNGFLLIRMLAQEYWAELHDSLYSQHEASSKASATSLHVYTLFCAVNP